jgi:hypothetical protein
MTMVVYNLSNVTMVVYDLSNVWIEHQLHNCKSYLTTYLNEITSIKKLDFLMSKITSMILSTIGAIISTHVIKYGF